MTLRHLDREPLAIGQTRQHVDETHPALVVGARELVEPDRGVDVLPTQRVVGEPEHALAGSGTPPSLADADDVGDPAPLHQALGEIRPVTGLDDRRIAHEQLHCGIEEPRSR